MRRILTLLAPDQQVYRRQCQTRGGIHRPDDGNPTHGMPSSDFGNLLMICFGRVRGIQTSLFVSSKVCAAPQTWYRGSRPIIATKPCSLLMVSPTATSLYGSFSPREQAGDITAGDSNKAACYAAMKLCLLRM